MKQYIFFLASVLFSISVCAQITGPKIVAVEDTFDFGDITDGTTVSHEFELVNQGTEELLIQQVKASCGCTAANTDKDKLAPGDTTRIKVSFNSTHRRGEQKKYVYVFSNDKETPQLRLMFTANVLANTGGAPKAALDAPKLLLSKNQHNFGKVEEGEVVSLNVILKNTGNKVLEISRVKSSCGCTAAILSSKVLQPGQTGTLNINLDTSDRKGMLTRTVTLYSNDIMHPEQTITLLVNISERNS